MTMDKTILRVQGLKTHFFTSYGTVKAVDGVDFHLERGETLGLVGESGCGKSVTSLSIMRLVPDPPGKIIAGKILFNGINLLDLTDEEMRRIRGAKIAMSFQDPMTYLNPVKKVGEQVAEAILLHQDIIKGEAMEKTMNIMELVGIPSPRERYNDYPHQFSGGMRQRIMIAMALSCNPDILIADEPTTNLDVLVQDQILELIKELQRNLNTSIIMITHDLGVVSEVSDRVAVMYAGKVVEIADVIDLFKEPLHPYTEGLLNSIPIIGAEKKRLSSIGGVVPNLIDPMPGCVFEPRCPKAMELCKTRPIMKEINGRIVACHLYR
jgi:oligopeptide/dipeptide ABC transporter ATP-binding protein